MKEAQETSVRANPITPAAWLPRALIYYPTRYADLDAAKADIGALHMIIYEHGSTEKGTNLELLKNNDLPKNLALGNIDKDYCIIVCPQTGSQFTGNVLIGVKEMMDVEYNGALSYNCTGLSMGGQGVYNLVAKYPTFFKTMGCLAGNDFQAATVEFPSYAAMYASISTSTTLIRHWHGEDDGSSNDYASGVDTVNRWPANGFPNEMTLVTMPSPAAHDIWPDVYYNDDLYFTWLESKILVDRDSGFTFTNIELVEWRYRSVNGEPLDDIYNGDNSWNDAVTRADAFVANPSSEYWDEDIVVDDINTYNKGHGILAAAFVGLVNEDNIYRQAAKTAILAQIANSNPVFENITSPYGHVFHFAGFTGRLFVAFDYCYDLFTAQEISDYETWMDRAIALYVANRDQYPTLNFPNRLSDDYSTVSWWALTGEEYTDPYYDDKTYTYTDSGGTRHNLIRKAHGWGNGGSLLNASIFLYSLYKNDTTNINLCKRWVKEWLMFAVWPDGTTSEGLRNGDYSRPPTGVMWYGAIVLECVLIIAEHLRRKGDTELYDFTTSDGIWGNDGGSKNIRLVVNTLVEGLRSTVDRYWWTVSEANRLDSLDGTYRYRAEMALAIANLNFKDATIAATYKNEASGCNQYDVAYGGPSYASNSNWVGNAPLWAALPLQIYGIEGVISAQTKQSNITLLL
jgi:hypothetical protein